MDNTVGSLTQFQRSLIIGSILGDGYLRKVAGRQDAFLEVNHSITASAYVDWKYSMLQSIVRTPPHYRKGNGNRIAYRFYTRQHPELSQLLKTFYRNDRKVIPDFTLDPLSLAVWFMDDGSKCRTYDVYLNTQQFNISNQKKLKTMLASMGMQTTLNKDKQYYRLRFLKTSIKLLNDLIAPYIIPAMRYKLSYDPVETHSLNGMESSVVTGG